MVRGGHSLQFICCHTESDSHCVSLRVLRPREQLSKLELNITAVLKDNFNDLYVRTK